MSKLTTRDILNRNLERNAPNRIRSLKIIMHNVRSMHNVGAAFRSADAFGIDQLIISGFSPSPPRPEISKTAIGAVEYVDWQKTENIEELLDTLRSREYVILGLEQTTDSLLLPDYSPPPNKNICLFFGNEVTGIDEDLLPQMDNFLEIPQYGHKHSLNVSVAVGVTLYAFLQKFW